jgi:hypothetical protein
MTGPGADRWSSTMCAPAHFARDQMPGRDGSSDAAPSESPRRKADVNRATLPTSAAANDDDICCGRTAAVCTLLVCRPLPSSKPGNGEKGGRCGNAPQPAIGRHILALRTRAGRVLQASWLDRGSAQFRRVRKIATGAAIGYGEARAKAACGRKYQIFYMFCGQSMVRARLFAAKSRERRGRGFGRCGGKNESRSPGER